MTTSRPGCKYLTFPPPSTDGTMTRGGRFCWFVFVAQLSVLSWALPEATLDDYAALRAALRARFLPPERVSLHRTQLRTRRRQRGESLSSLADDIPLLAARAYPDADANGQALVPQIALDSFVDALDDNLRRRIREREPANVQEALRRALTLECMDQSEQSRHSSFPSNTFPPRFPTHESAVDPPSQVLAASVPPHSAVDRFGALFARFEKAMDRMVAIVNRLSNVQPPVPPPRQAPRQLRRPVCYACGTPGHVRTECPHLHLPPSTSSSTPSQSSSLNWPRLVPASCHQPFLLVPTM